MAKLLGGTTIAGDLLVTGNVYMATPASGDNSIKAATTSFVNNYSVLKTQTGAFYPVTNPSGYIRSTQTGAFYPVTNPSGYILGNGTVSNVVAIGQSAYNMLSGSVSATVLYIITGV